MSGVVLYQSKYGATKRYAEWLSEETGFACTETRKASIDEVATYDTVILGGRALRLRHRWVVVPKEERSQACRKKGRRVLLRRIPLRGGGVPTGQGAQHER